MKRFLPIAATFAVVTLVAGPGRADGVTECRDKNGNAHYFMGATPPPNLKCTDYTLDRKQVAPKRAKCKTQRMRDTVFQRCVIDGIEWVFARQGGRRRHASSGAASRSTAPRDPVAARSPEPPRADDPVVSSDAAMPELTGLQSRHMDTGYLQDIIARASASQGIPVALLRAVIEVESGANPDVISPAGAQGLMQLMPVTAGYLDVEDPFDPEQNVMAGARLLRVLSDRFHGDVRKTVAAYYAGANAVRRAGGVPTRSAENYVAKVFARYQKYSNSAE